MMNIYIDVKVNRFEVQWTFCVKSEAMLYYHHLIYISYLPGCISFHIGSPP
jgi:hypothetical protein